MNPSQRAGSVLESLKSCDSFLVTHLPNIRYLTGFTGSSGCVLLTPRLRLFFTDFRYETQAAREVRGFGVRVVSGGLLEGACHHINTRSIKTGILGFEGDYLGYRQHLLLRRLLKGTRLKDAGGTVEALRLRKSRPEVHRIGRAAAIADAALAKLRRSRVVGKSERAVAAFLEHALRTAGSEKLPFDVIVASGPRSAMPHGVSTNRIIRKGELLLVDLGARIDGMCCDMTRTFATGRISARLRNAYRTVSEAQRRALAAVSPGVSCREIDLKARKHIADAGFGDAFGHSLGHGIGLEPHEAPVLSPRSEDVLAYGMVITVEPGIYLKGAGGIRIEDTLMAGRNGPVLLTGFPRQLITLR